MALEQVIKCPRTRNKFRDGSLGGHSPTGQRDYAICQLLYSYGVRGGQVRAFKSKTVTPHTLRHTTAMHLLRAGNDINMVSYWLGHADINTTHVYLEIDMEMKRKIIEKTDAPSIREKKPWHEPGILDWLNSLGKHPELCGVNQGVMNQTARVAGVNFT